MPSASNKKPSSSDNASEERATHAPRSLGIYAVAILLSAFLLFEVQLVMSKFLLPRFGGGPSVWSTSLLVFQFILLVGYGYAAWLSARFDSQMQGKIHLALIAASAALVGTLTLLWHSPILPADSWSRLWTLESGSSPVAHIAALLTIAVGLHCALLSATSPLLQKWVSVRDQGATPYRLYALSNLGSMLGLLSYPFLIERWLTLSAQAWTWAAGYFLFLAACGACAFLQLRGGDKPAGDAAAPARESRRKAKASLRRSESHPRVLWIALAACASVMLLATTNLICQEVAVIPLLWVVPLSLYLISFIICFDHARWYRREIFHPLYLVLALLTLETLVNYVDVPVARPLLIFCSTLFAVCMVCHGELARLKPSPEHLTSFYLMVSTGGALGSAFVVLLAPHIFDRYWEFQIALLGCGVLLAIVLLQDKASWFYQERIAGIPWGRVLLPASALLLGAGAYFYTSNLLIREGTGEDLVTLRTRNFFGVKTVVHFQQAHVLLHGRTMHGLQNDDPATRMEPTTYYSRNSGIGLLLANYPRAAGLRVGVVGMGAGTLAAYGQAGDSYRFYEIDPEIAGLSEGANPTFTFLQGSAAHSEVRIGDARVLLQDEASHGDFQKFDVLAVDAFSGDAVPVHLLTREAMALYLRHLRGPESVVAFHLTNRSLDLLPVVEALRRDYGLVGVEVHPKTGGGDWVLLSRQASMLQLPAIAAAGQPLAVERPIRSWTDNYSNLFEVLRPSGYWEEQAKRAGQGTP